MLELRLGVARGDDDRCVLALVHERDHVGVVEEVAQLLLDVAEVHVHDAGAHLVDAEHRLDPLDAVGAEDAHVVARLHARGLERVGEAGRALVELAERHLAALVDDRDAVGHLVGRQLEQVGEVVVPRRFAHVW